MPLPRYRKMLVEWPVRAPGIVCGPVWTPTGLRFDPSPPNQTRSRSATRSCGSSSAAISTRTEREGDREVVASALKRGPEEFVEGVRRELDDFLAEPLAEAELSSILHGSLGCDYDPSFQGLSRRDWLERVRLLLARG